MKVGYVRVSSRLQTEGLSLANQRRRLEQAGANYIYMDVESGAKESRKQYQQMIQDIKDGKISEVMVIRGDRLGRSYHLLQFVELLKEHKIILTILDSPLDIYSASGELYLSQLSAFATYERNLIIEKQRASHAYRRSQGIPGIPPFGYKYDRDGLIPDTRSYGDTDKTRWEVARELVEVFLVRGTIRGTLKIMADRYPYKGMKRRSDFPRSTMGLIDFFHLPTIRGMIHYQRQEIRIPGSHEPLITPEEYVSIKKLLKEAAKARGFVDQTKKHPLSGLVYCVCGSICGISRSGNPDKGIPLKKYYKCHAHAIGGIGCSDQPRGEKRRKMIRYEKIEYALQAELQLEAERLTEMIAAVDARKAKTKNPKIAELEHQLLGLKALPQNPAIDMAIEQLEEEQRRLIALEEAEATDADSEDYFEVLEKCKDPLFWKTVSLAEKRELYHFLCKRIVVKADEIVEIILDPALSTSAN